MRNDIKAKKKTFCNSIYFFSTVLERIKEAQSLICYRNNIILSVSSPLSSAQDKKPCLEEGTKLYLMGSSDVL